MIKKEAVMTNFRAGDRYFLEYVIVEGLVDY